MKKVLTILAFAALCMSCAKESENSANLGEARVSFKCSAMGSMAETTRSTYDIPAELVPAGDDFSLSITGSYMNAYGEKFDYSESFATIADYTENSSELYAGNYTASVSYGESGVESSTNPCFRGETDFTVEAGVDADVNIVASITNSAIRLSTTEWFDKYYSNATFTVTTEAGAQFTFANGDQTVFFVEPASSLTLSGSAVNAQTGSEVEFPATVIGTTVERTINTISVDASQAGGSSIKIVFDDTFTEVEPEDVELNPEL